MTTTTIKETNAYKLLIHKAYLDKGMSITNYAKYMIAFFGIASSSAKWTLIIGAFYGVFCYLLGFFWFKYKLYNAEIEISNQYNEFVKEVRTKISGQNINETFK